MTKKDTIYTTATGYKKMKELAPYIGYTITSALKVDKKTKQYLIGLKIDEIYHRYWYAKIRYTCNGYNEEKWIDVRAVNIIKEN